MKTKHYVFHRNRSNSSTVDENPCRLFKKITQQWNNNHDVFHWNRSTITVPPLMRIIVVFLEKQKHMKTKTRPFPENCFRLSYMLTCNMTLMDKLNDLKQSKLQPTSTKAKNDIIRETHLGNWNCNEANSSQRARRRRTTSSCKFTYVTGIDLARAARPPAHTNETKRFPGWGHKVRF